MNGVPAPGTPFPVSYMLWWKAASLPGQIDGMHVGKILQDCRPGLDKLTRFMNRTITPYLFCPCASNVCLTTLSNWTAIGDAGKEWEQTTVKTNFEVVARIESHRRQFPIPPKEKISQQAYDGLEDPHYAPKYMNMIYRSHYWASALLVSIFKSLSGGGSDSNIE